MILLCAELVTSSHCQLSYFSVSQLQGMHWGHGDLPAQLEVLQEHMHCFTHAHTYLLCRLLNQATSSTHPPTIMPQVPFSGNATCSTTTTAPNAASQLQKTHPTPNTNDEYMLTWLELQPAEERREECVATQTNKHQPAGAQEMEQLGLPCQLHICCGRAWREDAARRNKRCGCVGAAIEISRLQKGGKTPHQGTWWTSHQRNTPKPPQTWP